MGCETEKSTGVELSTGESTDGCVSLPHGDAPIGTANTHSRYSSSAASFVKIRGANLPSVVKESIARAVSNATGAPAATMCPAHRSAGLERSTKTDLQEPFSCLETSYLFSSRRNRFDRIPSLRFTAATSNLSGSNRRPAQVLVSRCSG